MIDAPVQGWVEAGFEPVRAAFADNFERHGDIGAACAAYVHGKLVVDLWGGVKMPGEDDPYTGQTLQVVASTTKGVVAIAAHILAQEGRLDFDAPVTDYWPEFGAAGKAGMPVRWLFSHRAGLSAVERPLSLEEVYAWEPVVHALEAQVPLWEPGTAHGYHVGTYGWLAGELIRRVSGQSLGSFVADRITRPLGAEFWIGLPDALHDRLAPLIPAPPPTGPPDVFTSRLLDRSSLLHRAFVNPMILPGTFNDPAFLRAEIPAANGTGTARGLSRIYAACIGKIDGVRLLEPGTLEQATVVRSAGEDLVLGYETAYATGFQLPFPFRPMAGKGSFGHYGMGGSVAFAQPETGVAFAYVMNQMQPSGGIDPRPQALVEALRSCVR